MEIRGNLFFTSDTHFDHFNILSYCARNFNNIHDMNENFIHEWNEIVTPEDTIFHIGDVALGMGSERFDALMSRLNGTKHLIVGNHDGGWVKRSIHWESVSKNMVLTISGFDIQLNHRPDFDKFRDWDIFLYGHTHSRLEHTHNTLDVGVDSAFKYFGKYRPMSIDDVVDIMEGVYD